MFKFKTSCLLASDITILKFKIHKILDSRCLTFKFSPSTINIDFNIFHA